MERTVMQSKIDAITGPAATVAGSSMLSLNWMLTEGMPVIVLMLNGLLAVAGIALTISKWRTSRIEREKALIELERMQNDD